MLLEKFFNTGCNTLILKKVQANILEELLQIASIKKQTILHMKALNKIVPNNKLNLSCENCSRAETRYMNKYSICTILILLQADL